MSDANRRLLEYYETLYSEEDRLERREGQLELVRTQELLARLLPAPPARVLDVGGGTGLYATWLAASGYEVQLIDLVPAHVAAAAATGARAACVGDARALPVAAATYDVVLLLGPLYHLRAAQDRVAALRESARVLRPEGLLVGAFISNVAPALDGFVKQWIWKDRRAANMLDSALNGLVAAERGVGFGSIAYFHRPEEIREELRAAGLADVELYGVEGPGWIAPDFVMRWSNSDDRELLLHIARTCEADPVLQVLSSHLLASARLPAPAAASSA